MINAVRNSVRDLFEMSLVSLLLNGDADRNSDVDLTDVGLRYVSSHSSLPKKLLISNSLPLLLQSDCSLGIAMKQYLDELSTFGDSSDSRKEEILTRGPKEWFPYSEDLKGDLEQAFGIWDRVCFFLLPFHAHRG